MPYLNRKQSALTLNINKRLSNIKEQDELGNDIHNLVDDFTESENKPVIKLNEVDRQVTSPVQLDNLLSLEGFDRLTTLQIPKTNQSMLSVPHRSLRGREDNGS